jgi:ribosomal protein L37AE/L43A
VFKAQTELAGRYGELYGLKVKEYVIEETSKLQSTAVIKQAKVL